MGVRRLLLRKVLVALIAAASLVGGGLYFWHWSKYSVAGAPTLDIRALTESGKVRHAAASPDGRYVAYEVRENGKSELRLLQVATERDAVVLPGTRERILSLHFSPDGNYVYFLRELDSKDSDTLGVFKIATLGGPATPLATDAKMYSVTVSPDGKQVAYIARTQSESQIMAVDPDGGNRRVLARRPIAFGFWFLEWSPRPNILAAVAISKAGMGLVSVDVSKGEIRDLNVTGWNAVGQPAWSPDGETVYTPALPAQGNSIFQVWAFDARTGAHRPVTSGSTNYFQPSLSATDAGDLVAITTAPNMTLWVTDPSGHASQVPALRSEGSDSVVWVDNRVVTSDVNEIIVHDLGTQTSNKIRSYSTIYRQLAPCGPVRVAYWAADAKRSSHIARTEITSGSTSALTDGTREDEPTCTQDGATLVFAHCEDQGNRCFLTRKSLDSGNSIVLHEFTSTDPNPYPAISPDGKNVLFLEQHAQDPYTWATIIPIGGGEPARLRMPVAFGEVDGFTWAADGKSVLYGRNENGVGNIWSMPLGDKSPKKLTAFESDAIYAFGVSPDNRLAISRGNFLFDVVLIKNVR